MEASALQLRRGRPNLEAAALGQLPPAFGLADQLQLQQVRLDDFLDLL
jgi:hypothetical protein